MTDTPKPAVDPAPAIVDPISEFLLARVKESEARFQGLDPEPHRAGLLLCKQIRMIVEWHKDWPVLLETTPQYSFEGFDKDNASYTISQKMEWVTQQEYVKRFGAAPLTTPLLRKMAALYKDHPDWDEEWAE